ncbi:glycosyltransferase family 2 protein [Negativicoccus succinicivorans]
MTYYMDIIMVPIQIIVALFTVYYTVLAISGMFRKKEVKILTPKNRFAIIVAAHNEEQVLGALIDNLFMLRYPRELYDVYVVADNCTDGTAQLARDHGAIVYERFNKQEVGKGYAMDWLFHKVYETGIEYDAFCVFDADNLVHLDFLTEMNSRLEKGEQVIQGYLSAKNPSDTWVSATFAMAFWIVNHLWHLGKYNIGLSTALGGTGMCISSRVLRTYGWGCNCLTEDMEFSMKILYEGNIRTTWADDAIVYDEKPLRFMQSWNQRKRWAQGHFDCAGRYIPKLFKRGFSTGNIRMLDGILQLSQPHFMLLSTFYLLMTYVNASVPFFTNVLYNDRVMPVEFWTTIGTLQFILPIIVLWRINVPKKVWLYIPMYPIFIYSWVPITFLGFLNRHKKEWSHTQHTRQISFDEVPLHLDSKGPN